MLHFPQTDPNGHIRLNNGWTVSVQLPRPGIYASEGTAELWAWCDERNWPSEPLGWQTPEECVRFIADVSEF